jgi:hypothetical protein
MLEWRRALYLSIMVMVPRSFALPGTQASEAAGVTSSQTAQRLRDHVKTMRGEQRRPEASRQARRELGRRPDSWYESQAARLPPSPNRTVAAARAAGPLPARAVVVTTGWVPPLPAKDREAAVTARERLDVLTGLLDGGRLKSSRAAALALCCYTVPLAAQTNSFGPRKRQRRGPMFSYFTFLIDFAAPLVALLVAEPRAGGGTRTLILPVRGPHPRHCLLSPFAVIPKGL